MTAVESASALITGVSLAVTATALMLNILSNRDDFEFGPTVLSITIFFIFLSFYLSMLYLYSAQFETVIDTISLNAIFLFVFITSAISIAIPILAFIRGTKTIAKAS